MHASNVHARYSVFQEIRADQFMISNPRWVAVDQLYRWPSAPDLFEPVRRLREFDFGLIISTTDMNDGVYSLSLNQYWLKRYMGTPHNMHSILPAPEFRRPHNVTPHHTHFLVGLNPAFLFSGMLLSLAHRQPNLAYSLVSSGTIGPRGRSAVITVAMDERYQTTCFTSTI